MAIDAFQQALRDETARALGELQLANITLLAQLTALEQSYRAAVRERDALKAKRDQAAAPDAAAEASPEPSQAE